MAGKLKLMAVVTHPLPPAVLPLHRPELPYMGKRVEVTKNQHLAQVAYDAAFGHLAIATARSNGTCPRPPVKAVSTDTSPVFIGFL